MNKTYYIDIENWLWVDASGARLSKYPALLANTVESWELHFVNSANAAVDLSNAATFKASVDDDFDHTSDPMCRTLNADIDSSQADDGILVITFDTRTEEYSDAVGSNKQISAYVEILGLDGDDIPIHSVLLDCVARNCIDPTGGAPSTPIPANYSFTTTNPPVPDPNAESKEYWIDVEKEVWIDVNGGIVNRYPPLQYGSTPQWKLHFMSLKTGVPVAVNLSAYTAYHIAAHTSYKAATPAIRCLNDSINSASKATGILYAAFDSRNTVFSGCVGTAKEASANIEILGFAGGLPAFSVILPVTFKNAVDPVGGTPPAVVGNYYTKAETDSLVLNKASTSHASTHAPAGSDALPWSTAHGKGATADKPAAAAGNNGYLYFDTDLGKLQRSNGTTWEDVAGSGAVASVFGRTGAVTAQNGDYTYSQVGAEQSGAVSSHAALTTGVHGVGAGTIAKTSDIPALSDSNPVALGTAAPGNGTTTARYNHVHPMPSASDVGADASGAATSAVSFHASLTTGVHGVGAGTIAKTSDIPALSSTTPANLGTAAVGDGTTTARSNHVHNMPSASDVGALAQADWNKIGRCGFTNNSETSLSFNGTDTLSLTKSGASWSYFRNGVLCTISASKTSVISAPAAATYFFYIGDTNGTITNTIVPWTLLDPSIIPVAIVVLNANNTPTFWMADERHTCLIDRKMHYIEHFNEGLKWTSGGALNNITVAPSSPTDAKNCFGINETLVMDEDLASTLTALTLPDGTAADYVVFYKTALFTYTWKASSAPFYYDGTDAIGNRYIWRDNGSSMSRGQNNKWYNSYVILTHYAGAARFIILPGQGEFSSLAEAQAEKPSSFTWTGFPIAEAKVAWQCTWSTGNYAVNGRCRLAATPVRIDTAVINGGSSAQTISHNSLSDLQGGVSGEYYHLSLTDVMNTALARSGYFTATDANAASAIVKRDASGNFAAGTITAALTGTASGNIPMVTPGTAGNLLTSNGSAWRSVTPSTGVYSTTFTNSDNRISTGVLTVTHNLGQRPLFIVMMDGSANPVDVSALAVYTSVNAFTVDLTNFGTLSGTWTLIASKGAGASVAAGFTNPMTTAGDIITATAGGTPARLAKGNALEVLRVNSGGTALEYATPSAGGMWTLVERWEPSETATEHAFANLNGNLDRRYLMNCRIKASGSNVSGRVYANTYNATPTYRVCWAYFPIGGSLSIGSANANGWGIGSSRNSNTCYTNQIEIDAKTGVPRIGRMFSSEMGSATSWAALEYAATSWDDTETNIASLTVTSTSFAVGTCIELWKLAQ